MVAHMQNVVCGHTALPNSFNEYLRSRLCVTNANRGHDAVEVMVNPDCLEVGIAIGNRYDTKSSGHPVENIFNVSIKLYVITRRVKDRERGLDQVLAVAGIHGNGTDSRLWAANGAEGPWAGSGDFQPAWNESYYLWDGNWLNWNASSA